MAELPTIQQSISSQYVSCQIGETKGVDPSPLWVEVCNDTEEDCLYSCFYLFVSCHQMEQNLGKTTYVD